MEIKEYKRNCPKCGKVLFYSSADSLSHCKNNKCCYCANVIRGKSSNRKGCRHTEETKKKMSLSKIGTKKSDDTKKKMSDFRKKLYNNPIEVKKLSEKVIKAMHRPEVRKKHIEALTNSKYLGKSVDKGQLEFIKEWNRFGFNFEINYQIKTDQDLFYIDGYDKEKNVVLEYDSKYHQKPIQKQKDLIRQQRIIKILQPKEFWRYNVVTKQCNNIIGDNINA